MAGLQALLGIVLIPLLATALSQDPRAAFSRQTLRFAGGALVLLVGLAVVLLKLPALRILFEWAGKAVEGLQKATDAGAGMVFGYLAGGPAPFEAVAPENTYVLAFRMLPMILVVAALMRLLFHWGVLQRIVAAFAWLLRRATGIGGPLATVASASIFLGPVEAPLLIRPYVAGMGKGALLATMTVGMATVAGTVLALYSGILSPHIPAAAGHLLAASILNVPAALMLARLASVDSFAEMEDRPSRPSAEHSRSSMDALVCGTVEGLSIAATVAAMLVVAVALVTLINMFLGLVGAPFGVVPTLQSILGVLCRPLAYVIGIPWAEAQAAGALLGQKFALNEFLAYLELARVPVEAMSERTRLILTYALCSFANLGSLGIMIGGLTAMVPERRDEVVALGPRAVVLGFLAPLLTAAIVGVLS